LPITARVNAGKGETHLSWVRIHIGVAPPAARGR